MKLTFEKQNERVTDWANKTVRLLKGESNALGIIHRSNSPSSGSSVAKIRDKFRLRDGEITVVRFTFPRTMIYPHHGAGKGMGGTIGSRWKDRLGITHTTDPRSLGKMGTGNRKIKHWFNNVMEGEQGVDELATIVAEETGDAISNNLFIK